VSDIASTIKSFSNPTDIFTSDWLEYMCNHGLPVTGIMTFGRPAGERPTNAHVDGLVDNSARPNYRDFAFNWVIGGRDSEMIWYDTADVQIPVSYTPARTPYRQLPTATLTEVDRCCIQHQPTLVRVNVLHAISVKDEPRIAISVRTNGLPNDWQIAINYLRDKKLLIER
jgi:hypothetical protein